MKRILLAVLVLTLFNPAGCQTTGYREGGTAVIVADRTNPTLAFAADELKSFLETATSLTIDDDRSCKSPAWKFILDVDVQLPPLTFAIQDVTLDHRTIIRLSGHGPTEVLHAVYTALERTGIRFDVLGPILPDRLALETLRRHPNRKPSDFLGKIADAAEGKGWSERVTPAVPLRGIRQHLNFPMDISSYPLDEAKEYVRNLARLRMNHITFHSYPTQWYSYTNAGGEVLAGHFFYNQRHDIPDHPAIRAAVRNRKTYCIPEIEALYDNVGKRDLAAKAWLNELIAEAKRVGMRVTFSIEIRDKSVEEGISACRAVLATYPAIDALEIITQEYGGSFGEDFTAEQMREAVGKYFGAEALKDPGVAAAIGPSNRQAPMVIEELARNIAVIRRIKEEEKRPGTHIVGVYAAHPRTLKVALALMRKYAPADVGFSFMAAYGGRPTARTVKTMGLTPDDLRRTTIHSWVEYDGNEYLQQNSIVGTKELLDLTGGNLRGLCFNHWRTAENRTAIRYAALATLEGPPPPATFYRDYAAALALGDVDAYVKAMEALDEVDFRVRKELSGIGFCFSGSWVNRPGLLWIRNWKPENLRAIEEEFARIRTMLAGTLPGTGSTAGREYVRFLLNRIECTEIHLEAVDHLIRLTPFCDDKAPEKLTDEERKDVLERCRAAEACVERYIQLHARAIADRGCEGTLVSYPYVMSAFIGKIKTSFGGLGRAAPAPKSGDAPPDPGGG